MNRKFIFNIENAIGLHWLVRWGIESLKDKQTEDFKCTFEAEHEGRKTVVTVSADKEYPDTVSVDIITNAGSQSRDVPVENLQALLIEAVEDRVLRKI